MFFLLRLRDRLIELQSSLEFIKNALPHLRSAILATSEIVLVGNKLDLAVGDFFRLYSLYSTTRDDPQTPASNALRAQARRLAEEEGLQYFEVSAKSGLNVSEMFRILARQLRTA